MDDGLRFIHSQRFILFYDTNLKFSNPIQLVLYTHLLVARAGNHPAKRRAFHSQNSLKIPVIQKRAPFLFN